MFTILIPVLKQGFLESQLRWLSKQTYLDFSVIAMDSHHNQTRALPWATKSYPFQFTHVPTIQNLSFPKRCDFSIKNNLALLALTDSFIFVSDTSYFREDFAERIAYAIDVGPYTFGFYQRSVSFNAYDSFAHTVNPAGVVPVPPKPVFIFNRKGFFYTLNGFDEALTYNHCYDSMPLRIAHLFKKKAVLHDNALYHIVHAANQNYFGKRHRTPCEKCDQLFPGWKFDRADDTGEFPNTGHTADVVEQMIGRDPLTGLSVFECPNCGFGGMLNPSEYKNTILSNYISEAPHTAFDGRSGRLLWKIHETINKKIGVNTQSRMAYLTTTY